MSIKMQDKYRNFFDFIANAVQEHIPESETPPDLDNIRTLADDESFYKNLQFVYLPLLCNNSKARERIKRLRDLHKDEVDMDFTICEIRRFLGDTKKILDSVEHMPDDKLRETLSKVSRYIHLFSMMYFTAEQ